MSCSSPSTTATGTATPPGPTATARAANELTRTSWDPVSKQPHFKVAAVRLVKVADADGMVSPAPTVGGPAPVAPTVPATAGGEPALAISITEPER